MPGERCKYCNNVLDNGTDHFYCTVAYQAGRDRLRAELDELLNIHKDCHPAMKELVADLAHERQTREAVGQEAAKWKASRIEFQTIVYDCCNAVDEPGAARQGKGTTIDVVAGRVRALRERAETAEADAMAVVLSQEGTIERLRAELEEAKTIQRFGVFSVEKELVRERAELDAVDRERDETHQARLIGLKAEDVLRVERDEALAQVAALREIIADWEKANTNGLDDPWYGVLERLRALTPEFVKRDEAVAGEPRSADSPEEQPAAATTPVREESCEECHGQGTTPSMVHPDKPIQDVPCSTCAACPGKKGESDEG